MSRPFEADVIDQAVAWHIRLRNGDGDAWIRFTEWLEADPTHNDAYTWVVDNDSQIEPAIKRASFPGKRQPLPMANDDHADEVDQARTGSMLVSRRWAWGAIAASLAFVALFTGQVLTGPASYTLQTRPGETHTVTLADGSKIALNGATTIKLDRNDPRIAELVEGEAQFTVVHDEANPFVVNVAGRRLVDIGTVFNVTHSSDQLELEVSDGAVRFEGTAQVIELQAGEGLSIDQANNIAIFQKSIDAMGSWTEGMLVYEGATLAEIGGDISRATGVAIEFSPALRGRRFSGVIQTNGGHEEIRSRLEQLLDLAVDASGDRWIVGP